LKVVKRFTIRNEKQKQENIQKMSLLVVECAILNPAIESTPGTTERRTSCSMKLSSCWTLAASTIS
jgi:hypothetical protein